MENTPKNKAQFFAFYWGQEIMRWHQWLKSTKSSIIDFKIPMQSEVGIDDGWYLELKPVSLITKTEAKSLIEQKFICDKGDIKDVISIKAEIGTDVNKVNAVAVSAVIKHKKWADFVEGVFIADWTRTNYVHVDYLRSRGYAVPWMGLSVEKLLEYGWIKYKSK